MSWRRDVKRKRKLEGKVKEESSGKRVEKEETT
jgi:hypothetical protein